MEVLFLGTSSMVPTKERNHSSILVSHGNERILVDCGEGTQRQLKIVGAKLTKITKILISHWHGDHVLGLPGLIQSMAASDYKGTLCIYGPEGIKTNVKKMLELFPFENKFNIEVEELSRGRFFSNEDIILECAPLRHGIASLGYSLHESDKRKINMEYIRKAGIPKGPLLGQLQSGKTITWKGKKVSPESATKLLKGKKVTIINDTLPCKAAENLSKNSDLLVCEATYSSDMGEKAKKHMHMTSSQAADLAKKSGSKKLVITHFSSRYKDAEVLAKEARAHFRNAVAAKDFMKISV